VPITNGALTHTPPGVTISATIGWNAGGVGAGLTVGNIRVLAIDVTTHLPTLIDSEDETVTGAPQQYKSPLITDPTKLAAMATGNRVVVTATQHKPLGLAFSTPYYVTVDSLQPGPSRGPVGSVDCSDRPIQAGPSFQRCDLTGAVLTQAALPNTNLQHADLSGADLSRANVSTDNMAGAWLGGANLTNTHSSNVSLLNAVAPGLNISGTSTLNSDNFSHAQLQGSNFSGASMSGTTFFTARMTGASLVGTVLNGGDEFTATDLQGAEMQSMTIDAGSEFFLAELQNANLTGAKVANLDQLKRQAIFCNTTMPDGTTIDNDDCGIPGLSR
jgi:uncharacterized protein YjbI with pentapeptide repeats